MSIIYVLTNPAMPGLVKIGKTTRQDPQVRMNELYSTGVPLPFECNIAVKVEDERADELEKALHKAFSPNRLNPSREFFEIELYQVEAIMRTWPYEDVTPQVNKETENLPPEDRAAATEYKRTRRPNLNFEEMGIPIGSKLTSTITEDEAIVISHRKVFFRGEEMSLTMAAQKALGPDYTQPIRGTSHFSYQDRPLVEIYEETYDQQDIESE